MKVHGSTLRACVLLSMAVVAQSVMNEGPRPERPPGSPRKDGWRLQRSGAPGGPIRHGPGGGPGPGAQLKRVYHVPQMKYGPPGHKPLRRQHPQKMRYGPPGPPSGVRGPPPPGWKSKRINPPGNYGPPPRKVWNPKPHKYQKPYSKVSSKPSNPKIDSFGSGISSSSVSNSASSSASSGISSSYNQQVQTDSYGAPKTVYKVHKVPQTTYGIPHPTQGSPEPPKTADDSHSSSVSGGSASPAATSFVHVFQGGSGGDQELETKTSYSFGDHSSSSGYPEKYKGKVYDDLSNHSPDYGQSTSEPRPKKVGFQPPKQTYGFQPYDDKDHFSLTPSHSFFSVSSQQPVSSSGQDSLSHNYYDQNS